ncbi:hypothetical protein DFH29DRAFT_813952, partial [Suillus ampliporus]
LNPDEIRRFICEGYVDMPVIMEADIADKSKGDVLSKGIAILQLVWFVIQLVARYVQNLPITLLEIDTLAVAALTCISYGLWWKKPKDIGCPCIVHWKATGSPTYLSYKSVDNHPYLFYLMDTFLGLSSASVIISPYDVCSRRVPTLGGYESPHHGQFVVLFGYFSGMVFGGIHCLGWKFLFQRHADQILWRAASVGMAIAPLYGFLNKIPDLLEKILGLLFAGLGVISALIYIPARVTLVAPMILSLRSLPPGVYDAVAWINFIPHL